MMFALRRRHALSGALLGTLLGALFCILGLCLTPLAAQAESTRAGSALTENRLTENALIELRAKAAGIRSVQSDFTQETAIPLFTESLRSTGRFVFAKPSSLLWEYLSPVHEGFALHGDAGFRWQDDKNSRTPFTPGSDPVATIIARQLMAWITFDTASIEREYRITLLPTPPHAPSAPQAGAPLRLQMTPLSKDLAQIIASITITFTPEGPASQVELKETRGGTTVIGFSNTLVNAPIQDGVFR